MSSDIIDRFDIFKQRNKQRATIWRFYNSIYRVRKNANGHEKSTYTEIIGRVARTFFLTSEAQYEKRRNSRVDQMKEQSGKRQHSHKECAFSILRFLIECHCPVTICNSFFARLRRDSDFQFAATFCLSFSAMSMIFPERDYRVECQCLLASDCCDYWNTEGNNRWRAYRDEHEAARKLRVTKSKRAASASPPTLQTVLQNGLSSGTMYAASAGAKRVCVRDHALLTYETLTGSVSTLRA